MNKLEERKFKLHSQKAEYQDRVEKAKRWIHEIFDRYDNPCLNYSGGKDSLVLLHLVAEKCGYSNVDIYHFDNGLLEVPGSTSFVEESSARIGGNLFQRTSKKANSREMVTEQGHGYKGFWGWYSYLSEKQDWDVRLLGIRATESSERQHRFNSKTLAPPVNPEEEYTSAAPVHHFTTRDIWAYIVDHRLEYHSIYDKQGELYGGMEAKENRLVTLYDSEFDSLGARTISQFLFPGRTNELKDIEQK